MIGRKALPQSYLDWNRKWRAPLPDRHPEQYELLGKPFRARRRLSPFEFQPNSTTRTFEYPWAYEAVGPRRGQRIVEVGGALSGFQFTLSATGAEVINVDPFFDYGSVTSYARARDPFAVIAQMNKVWRTSVELRRATIDQADLATSSVDTVVCVSTIEHLPADQRTAIIDEAVRVLKPGGRLVLTIDLFFDVTPFAEATTNRWGTNVDVAELVSRPELRLVQGERCEMLGFEEFDADWVLAHRDELFVGKYPGVAQALVMEHS